MQMSIDWNEGKGCYQTPDGQAVPISFVDALPEVLTAHAFRPNYRPRHLELIDGMVHVLDGQIIDRWGHHLNKG